jgi:hypothetical protein
MVCVVCVYGVCVVCARVWCVYVVFGVCVCVWCVRSVCVVCVCGVCVCGVCVDMRWDTNPRLQKTHTAAYSTQSLPTKGIGRHSDNIYTAATLNT